MDSRFYFKCLIAVTIALSGLKLQQNAYAQARSNRSNTSSLDFKDRLASPWSNAALIHTLESTAPVNAIAFSPDGKTLATVESKQITLWDTDKGKVKRVIPGHYSTKYDLELAPTAIAFSPDSSFLATVTWSQGSLSPDESLTVWNIATGEKAWSLPESTGCRQVMFDTSGIIYAACDLGITAWSFPQGDKLFSFDLEYPVDAIALSPDGKVMATVDANITGGQQGEKSNQIQLWTLEGDKPALLNTLNGHSNDIAQIEFTADGKKLVSSSYDGKINVWNWQSGKIERRTNNLSNSNGFFSLSEDSRLIAGNFHSSAMTSLVTGLPLRNAIAALNKQETKMLSFSPQGKLFAGVKSLSDRSEIYIWQNNSQHQARQPKIADEYLPIKIADYWQDPSEDGDKPSAIGKDPQAISLAALGLTEIIESEQEEVAIDYPQEDLAVVTITQTNLLDDSVAGIRYQIEFTPYGDSAEQLWQITSAGQQFKCRRDRGHQNWSKDLCQ